jgi:coproporphyrinogen III oxidase-like Fe-S oxidoreductase
VQVEASTPFGRWESQGLLSLPSEDASAEQWVAASQTLREAGLEHYELSNYAQAGHRCLHNQVYWLGHSYYAFGLGASSYLKGARHSRPRTMKAWEDYVNNGTGKFHYSDTDGASADVQAASEEDRLLDAIMLQLRLARGLDLRWMQKSFGAARVGQVLGAVQDHMSCGRAEVVIDGNSSSVGEALSALSNAQERQNVAVCLTDPDGFMLSNDIISDVFFKVQK